MGRSVSYATGAQVITFRHLEDVDCYACEGTGKNPDFDHEQDAEEEETCDTCNGSGKVETDSDDFDQIIDDFRDHLRYLFPSVTSADRWIDREDHVLAENGLASFGISEYCGLVSYWIVPKEADYYGPNIEPLAKRWIDSIADKFIAAFGELTKVGSMSNGEGVYRQIKN